MPSRPPLRLALAPLLLLAAACHATRPDVLPASRRMAAVSALVGARPAAVGMDPWLGRELDSIATAAVARRTAPGMAIAVGRYGRLVHLKGYGHIDWAPGMPAVDGRTLYDLASLTKVIATTTAAMILEEAGLLAVDSTVAHYLPEFAAYDTLKARITVRMLLTHSGGLEAYAPLYEHYRGRAQYLEQIARRPLKSIPGTAMVYSDWDMIVLQLVLERISGEPLDVFCERRIFAPLGMRDTHFLPDPALRPRIAATAVDTTRGGLLWGVVHDGNAWAMGGVSGHAGLFSTATDLAIFAHFLLNGGEYGGVRLLHPATIARWTARQDAGSSRALGWDTPSPPSSSGQHFSPRSFGHTGFTGTSFWVDPERGLFVIVLANRVNSEGSTTTHTALRRDVGDAVQEAVLNAPLLDWEQAAGHGQ
jgi:CubicO group peptidase (beta-lactamase class C family)